MDLSNIKLRIRTYMNENYSTDFTIKYIEKNCIKEIDEKLKVANLLLDNIFLFDDTWDMEACRVPYANKNLQWDYCPNGDEEWTFMLARHEYLEGLLIAYYIKNDEKYINKIKEIIHNWIDNNDLDSEFNKDTKRAIDTGIRCSSWLNMIIHLVNISKIDDKELFKFINSISEQLNYLKKIYLEKYTLSNWGVLQTVSIINNIRWFKELINDSELLDWACDEFEKQCNIQVFDDGSHWEQSPMYHVEVLRCLNSYIWNSNILGYRVSENILNIADKMSEYILYTKSPKGYFEAQCDSDRTFVKDILECGVIVSGNKKIKSVLAEEALELCTAFKYGEFGYKKYCNATRDNNFNVSKSFIDSGNIYIRNDFSSTSDFTVLKNGTMGSGHGHSDLGHISLYYKGEPFLVDTGRYSYLESDKLREFFKSAYAHNVSIIDNKPAAVSKGSWDCEYYSDVFKNYYKNIEGVHYSELAYLSDYEEGACNVFKKIIYVDVGIWFIITYIRFKGNHMLKNYYNFDNNVKLSGYKDSYKAFNKNELDFKFYNVDKSDLKISILSKKYNELSQCKKIITETEFKDFTSTATLILGTKAYKNIEDVKIRRCDDSKEEKISDYIAKKVVISDVESYIFIIFNNETYSGKKMYYANEHSVYGKTIVIHTLNGVSKTNMLKG